LIRKNKIIREIFIDFVFYSFFFIFGVVFIFGKIGGREESVMILEAPHNEKEIVAEENTQKVNNNQKFVASSRGKYFYEVGSKRANSLSEQNKIYFETEDEAKNLGFKPYIDN